MFQLNVITPRAKAFLKSPEWTVMLRFDIRSVSIQFKIISPSSCMINQVTIDSTEVHDISERWFQLWDLFTQNTIFKI